MFHTRDTNVTQTQFTLDEQLLLEKGVIYNLIIEMKNVIIRLDTKQQKAIRYLATVDVNTQKLMDQQYKNNLTHKGQYNKKYKAEDYA
jgi:hypothetical protein